MIRVYKTTRSGPSDTNDESPTTLVLHCLVDAPGAQLAVEVHRNSHGLVGSEIIPVDRDTAARFLGRIVDPTHSDALPTAFRTIMFTDMVDSTKMTLDLGDDEALRRLRIHDSIIRTTLDGHEGREVKHTGDGILASFDTVTTGIRGSIAIQNAFRLHNKEYADPGSVYVSSAVRVLAAGKQFTFGDPTQVDLKGFDQPVQVSRVLWDTSTSRFIDPKVDPTSSLRRPQQERPPGCAPGGSLIYR